MNDEVVEKVCLGCGSQDDLIYVADAGDWICDACVQASIPEDVRHYG